MKIMSLIILVLLLLQPFACFAHPCDSFQDIPHSADTSGQSGSHTPGHDDDGCDSTVCCAEYVHLDSGITIIYAPLVSVNNLPVPYQKLPPVVIPIFIPPQNLA